MPADVPTDPHVTAVRSAPATSDAAPSRDAFLVVIYGDDLGRRVPLSAEPLVIGRSSKSAIQLDEQSVSRRHCEVTFEDGRYVVRDLDSTNGTYLNDLPVERGDLRDGDQLKVGPTIFKFLSGDTVEASYHDEIYRLMTIDGLTQVHNRRYFDEALDREVARATRYGRPLSLLVFDIDLFKAVNDRHGHLAGDAVLRQLATAAAARCRVNDVFARTGGEEFSLLLPEVAIEEARALGETVRARIEAHRFVFERVEIAVTVSVGVAAWRAHMTDPIALMQVADARLYDAKRAGRNAVRG